MNHDHQLVRDHSGPGFNLAVGEPFFLRQALYLGTEFHIAPAEATGSYPLLGGEKGLLSELKRLHPGRFVVVTNGATQAAQAALYAFYEEFVEAGDQDNLMGVHVEKPYWPRYPTLADRMNMWFSERPVFTQDPALRRGQVSVVTVPNNPDGSCIFGPERYDIWDAAYAHEVYGWDGKEPKHQIGIWSAAKLLGLSGARIGWLVTADPMLAKRASMFVEQTTSGVSSISQHVVANVLRWMREESGEVHQRHKVARRTLIRNGEIFLENLAGHCDGLYGVPQTMRGMFAWFKVREPTRFARALKKAQVSVVTGDACGYRPDGWYRMSMGQTNEVTARALTALKEALNG